MLTTNDVGRILGEKAVKYTDLFNALNKACTEEERERILNLFEEYGIKREIEITPYILISKTSYELNLTDEYRELIGLME